MTGTAAQTVRRRHMFYVPGYDPTSPRRYREMYRTEGTSQAQISSYELTLTGKQVSPDYYGWQVDTVIDGQTTHTDVEMMVWSDIVQSSMDHGVLRTYWLLLRTAWEYIATGALLRLVKLRIGPILAALYPVAMLTLQLAVALLFASAAYWVVDQLAHPVLALVAWVLVLVGILRWFKGRDGQLLAYYLMHDYGFSAQFQGRNPPELEARMAEFTNRIEDILQSDVDEVLVVGHSSGAHIATSLLADVLRRGGPRKDGPKLAFLSVGQVIPMVSFLRHADRLRGDLQYLSQSDDLIWVDVSAPGDGANFALCDPVAVSGVATPAKKHPLMLSAAFTQTLSPERYKYLKRKFFRLHFQYICAFDRPGDYDYFQISAGPITLAERYADRAPSPSRIEEPRNRFTSVSAP